MTRLPLSSIPDRPLFFALPGAEQIVNGVRQHWPGELGQLRLHRFPDGECGPFFDRELTGRDVILAAVLDNPDAKLLSLYLAASVARELGARSIGLLLPYLPYMRQDIAFRPGEGTTARHVAALLSSCADWLVTVDPHLHRIAHLDQVYSIPALAVSSAVPLTQWIGANVDRPVIVGPDGESAQWVAEVAGRLNCPFVVMRKDRGGDRAVRVSLDGAGLPAGHTPVLLDDIASSGHTMAAAIGQLREHGAAAPVCIVVHALFAGDALAVLERAGPAKVVSCNTVPHATNAVDISKPLAQAAALLLLARRSEEVR